MRPLRFAAAFVVIAAVAVGAFAWIAAGRDRYGATRAQAQALVRLLAAEVGDAVASVARVEDEVARRLEAAARLADGVLSVSHRPRRDVLRGVARTTHVGWIALVEPGATTIVRWPLPVGRDDGDPGEDDAPAERADAERAAAALLPPAGEARVEGATHQNAFGSPRERFGVAYGREDGGTLLLRASVEELAETRRRLGLGAVLHRVQGVPGVEGAAVSGERGGVASGTLPIGIPALNERPEPGSDVVVRSAPRVVVAATSLTLAGEKGPVDVRVALSTAGADAALARTRRTILLATAVVAIVAVAAALGFGVLERRHAAQRARLEAQREEDRRLADLGAVASLLTHEISNPLNSIRLGLHLLAQDGAGGGAPPPANLPATLRAEADRMAATMESVLALARARRTGLERVTPGVLPLAASRVEAEAAAKRIRLVVETQAGAPPAAAGDPVVVEQALSSVLRNAVQASPAGGRVRAAWIRAEDGGVRIAVEDEGPGFPQEGREELLALGRPGRPGGHGLGLALAKRFVEAEGGRVALLDAEGGGARVEIALPAAKAGPA